MRFQGRDRAEGGRAGLVRRSRRSVRLVPQALSTGTSPVESLESRLLLSVFSGGGNAISFEPLPVDRSFTVPAYSTAATLSVHATDAALPPMTAVPQPTNSPTPGWGGGYAGQMGGGISPIGPMLMLMKTVSQVNLATSGMLVVTTTRTGSLGEDSIAPVVVMPPANLLPSSSVPHSPWSPSGGSTGSTASTGWIRSTEWAGGGAGDSPSSDSSSTTPMMSMATLPDASNVQYDGTWTGPPGTTAVQLPVGPMTHEVGVTIRPGPNTGIGDGPILAGLTLLDKDGDTLASIAPLWNPLTNSPVNAITVTLNGAPVGGTLVVQLASPLEGSVAGSAATSVPGGMAVPYVMDVQRIDALANNGAGQGMLASSQPGFLGSDIGTLQWTTNQASVSNSFVSSSSSENTPLLTNSSFIADPTLETPAADASAASFVSDNATDAGGRIPLGPLASRSAAPMGPNLVSAWLDATPAVDRHERGVSQAIDDRPYDDDLPDPDDNADPSVSSVVLASVGGRARPPERPRTDADDAPTGLGPMPLKTADAAAPAPGSPDLDDLLAALAVTTRHERPVPSVPAGPDDSGPTLGLLGTIRHDADSRPAPDYLTTAFVLALGMGLTTGPILPDLMRLIPRRDGRRGFVPAGAARFFARNPGRARLFGDERWRPAFLASRQAD